VPWQIEKPNCPGRYSVFVVVELSAKIDFERVWSFSRLLTMIPLEKTGPQFERLSGLPSLEGSQGLRDLRAKDWAALRDHGGGRCFRRKEGRSRSRERRTESFLSAGPLYSAAAISSHVPYLIIDLDQIPVRPSASFSFTTCWHIHTSMTIHYYRRQPDCCVDLLSCH
jgi:hypothetical protein